MKNILILGFVYSLFVSFSFASTSFLEGNYNKHDVKIIKVVLDENTKLVVNAVKPYHKAKSLKTLMEEVGGSSAINGAFFCPGEKKYSWCTAYDTTKIRIVNLNGKDYSRFWKDTGENGILGVDKNGKGIFVQNNMGYAGGYENNTNKDKIDDIQYGIAMTILIDSGKVVSDKSSLINDPKQSKKLLKEFICFQKDKKTFYMGTVSKISLLDLGYYLKDTFSCENAILLDAGWSKNIIYKGKQISKGRDIMDAFIVVEKKEEKENLKYSNFKLQIDKVLNIFFKKLEKFKKEKQISKLELILNKIKLVKKTNKIKNNSKLKYVIGYLEEKINNKLKEVNF